MCAKALKAFCNAKSNFSGYLPKSYPLTPYQLYLHKKRGV